MHRQHSPITCADQGCTYVALTHRIPHLKVVHPDSPESPAQNPTTRCLRRWPESPWQYRRLRLPPPGGTEPIDRGRRPRRQTARTRQSLHDCVTRLCFWSLGCGRWAAMDRECRCRCVGGSVHMRRHLCRQTCIVPCPCGIDCTKHGALANLTLLEENVLRN